MKAIKRVSAAPNPLRFGTKAATLERLGPILQNAKILPQFAFTVGEWNRRRMGIVDQILQLPWASQSSLIVRSSSLQEDQGEASNAGRFRSVPGIQGRSQLAVAVETVKHSYGRTQDRDEILVQPMLSEVELSGVAFTVDPSSGAPYYVVSYDRSSGHSDTVTSGTTSAVETLYHLKGSGKPLPSPLANLHPLLCELEGLFENPHIDVEFCVHQGTLVLLQVRPIVGKLPCAVSPPHLKEALTRLEHGIRARQGAKYGICGQTTLFGMMPDWNPAEIIGERPRPLAFSLYRELVTDRVWAQQRHDYGYRDVEDHPLMVSFHGVPYIDVRVSLNSFIPRTLDDKLAEKLVDHYLQSLIRAPHAHDKIEFDIVPTCYALDTPNEIDAIGGLSSDERSHVQRALLEITQRILTDQDDTWSKELTRIRTLEQNMARLDAAALPKLAQIYWMIQDCKRFGTLPFAGLARSAFVAMKMLVSLVKTGILSPEDKEHFLRSLQTTSSNLAQDFHGLPRKAFLNRYGHLRPSTYDIRSPRYDEEPWRYFSKQRSTAGNALDPPPFKLRDTQIRQLDQALTQHQLGLGGLELFRLIRRAIEAREHAKFVFSRSVSQTLAKLTAVGTELGFSRDQLSYLDIGVIAQLYGTCEDPQAAFRRSIAQGEARYLLTKSLRLPVLISNADQIWSFHAFHCAPNFITSKSAEGRVTSSDLSPTELAASIVMIPSADPGYDWIFTCGIAGFVTMYGGANSHMAIRAAEYGIPAVIGAGEQNYRSWSQMQRIRIDCENRTVHSGLSL